MQVSSLSNYYMVISLSVFRLHRENICVITPATKFLHCYILLQVIAATNRVDILDPALLRSGRLDRKIEFPHPNEEARARIMQIHSRKMNISNCVNFDELSRSTDDFNGAQCKAVCVEAVSSFLFLLFLLI